MGTRQELHTKLCELLGSEHVYFQPPESLKLEYPAIVYERADIWNDHADNIPYRQFMGYELTLIDPNPDSEFVAKIAALSTCDFDRHYASDNLNHDVFTLYY